MWFLAPDSVCFHCGYKRKLNCLLTITIKVSIKLSFLEGKVDTDLEPELRGGCVFNQNLIIQIDLTEQLRKKSKTKSCRSISLLAGFLSMLTEAVSK